jgi:hypothetical protein
MFHVLAHLPLRCTPEGCQPMGGPQGCQPMGGPQGCQPMGGPQGCQPMGGPQGVRELPSPSLDKDDPSVWEGHLDLAAPGEAQAERSAAEAPCPLDREPLRPAEPFERAGG